MLDGGGSSRAAEQEMPQGYHPKEKNNLSGKPGIPSMSDPGALHSTALVTVGDSLMLTLSDTNLEGVSRRTVVT
ncbi:hypothetical protein BTVI_22707 [Pitangus sulphuratus]|nr:hypothetical protein BTVI_22707 [Pitangus sulphuratus]